VLALEPAQSDIARSAWRIGFDAALAATVAADSPRLLPRRRLLALRTGAVRLRRPVDAAVRLAERRTRDPSRCDAPAWEQSVVFREVKE
jgi:hypothetical protein